MTTIYSVTDALYDELLIRLTDATAETDYFSGTLSFEFEGVACCLTASLIVVRRPERRPEGEFTRLDDWIPVWWEFHTRTAEGDELLNDFSFDSLRARF